MPGKDADPVIYVLQRRAVRRIDRLSAGKYRLPTLVLMENAAALAAGETFKMIPRRGHRAVLIVCGPGNNGGDGLAMARHLSNAGVPVRIVLAVPARAYGGDAAVQLGVAQRMGLPIEWSLGKGRRPAVVVDALFGTGLTRPVEGPMLRLIEGINALGRKGSRVLSVDIPSGLDCDTGQPLGAAVRADVTVTFVGLKVGFLKPAAAPYLGEVVVADIGSPAALTKQLGKRLPSAKRR